MRKPAPSREAQAANFARVSPERQRAPSSMNFRAQKPPSSAPPPPSVRTPKEFVAAFQREMESCPPRAPSAMPPPVPVPAPPAEPKPSPEMVTALTHAIEELAVTRSRVFAETTGQLAELAAMI